MRGKFLLSFGGLLFLLSCSSQKGEKIIVPDSLFIFSKNPRESIVGKYQYANNLFFEFEAGKSDREGKWIYYIDYGNEKQIQFKGEWSVFDYNPNTSSGLLKLQYKEIGLTDMVQVDPKTNKPKHSFYPFIRTQIVEYYTDDNYFGMNVYHKVDSKHPFFGKWEHRNYDWFDNVYLWGDAPFWMKMQDFEKKILAYIESPSERKFVESLYQLNRDNYYRRPDLTEEQLFKLQSIMEMVKSKGGYKGEWFSLSLASIPKMQSYYVNRSGVLEIKEYNEVVYKQYPHYFTASMGDWVKDLPTLAKPTFYADDTVKANYMIWESDILDDKARPIGKEVFLKFYNSSLQYVLGNWEFKVLVIKDKNLLLTYPFKRIK